MSQKAFEQKEPLPEIPQIEQKYDPGLQLLGVSSKQSEAGTQTGVCTPTFRAAALTAAEMWRQPRGPSAGEGTHTPWSAHTVEYYSASKRKAILTQAVCGWALRASCWWNGPVTKGQSLSDASCTRPLER